MGVVALRGKEMGLACLEVDGCGEGGRYRLGCGLVMAAAGLFSNIAAFGKSGTASEGFSARGSGNERSAALRAFLIE
ncbi:MAG TPA: hypothetical protein PLT23_03190, partial [Lentisphaeria bacterium]|nr:hypothetical protein [Lentisphaeria bacterium]